MTTDTEMRSYAAPAGVLADRVILVTGAGGGLGSALSLACAALGARIVLCGRRVAPLERVYDAIVAAGGPRPSIAPLDLERADATHYEALAEGVRNEFGRLDGLVHAAARPGERSPIEHHDVASWLRIMHVNANAPFILTRALLPLLRRSQDASVLFVTCAVSLRGRAYAGADAAAKFALEGLMQVLADETEGSTDIRVNSIDPGPMRTHLRRAAYPGEDPATIPEPREVLAPFLCLLGPAGRGITGRRVEAR